MKLNRLLTIILIAVLIMAITHANVKVSGEKGYASEWNAAHTVDDDSKPKNDTTLIVAASDSLDTTRADYVCDGIDDQDTINTAMAALPAHGGAVSLLDGTYQITDKIIIPGNDITIIGLGSNTVIQTTDNVRMIEASNKEGLLISSLRIVGPGPPNIQNSGIMLDTVTRSRITDVWIEDTGLNGIYMTGCSFITVTDSFVTDAVFVGIRLVNTNYTVLDTVAAQSAVAGALGIELSISNYCKVSNCYTDLNVYGLGINTNAGHNAIISGTFINNTDTGILIGAGCDRNIILGNMVVGNAVAQITDNGANNIVEHNQVL